MADNVNNLNGIPNFGHGFPETPVEVTPEVEEATPKSEEEVEITNQEEE